VSNLLLYQCLFVNATAAANTQILITAVAAATCPVVLITQCQVLQLAAPPYDEWSDAAAGPAPTPGLISGTVLQQLAVQALHVTTLSISGVPGFSDQVGKVSHCNTTRFSFLLF
jgi:hypothetical protein